MYCGDRSEPLCLANSDWRHLRRHGDCRRCGGRGERKTSPAMSDLSPLLHSPGGHTLRYTDPAFPEQPLLLHSAVPQCHDPDTPIVIVHHGVGRNGRDYRDYWLRLVDAAGVLAIAIEFTEQHFP